MPLYLSDLKLTIQVLKLFIDVLQLVISGAIQLVIVLATCILATEHKAIQQYFNQNRHSTGFWTFNLEGAGFIPQFNNPYLLHSDICIHYKLLWLKLSKWLNRSVTI